VHSAGRWEHPFGQQALIIGEVVDEHHGLILLRTAVGGTRSARLLRRHTVAAAMTHLRLIFPYIKIVFHSVQP
jgi:hypothetical protein